jgi:hypothetical protein
LGQGEDSDRAVLYYKNCLRESSKWEDLIWHECWWPDKKEKLIKESKKRKRCDEPHRKLMGKIEDLDADLCVSSIKSLVTDVKGNIIFADAQNKCFRLIHRNLKGLAKRLIMIAWKKKEESGFSKLPKEIINVIFSFVNVA